MGECHSFDFFSPGNIQPLHYIRSLQISHHHRDKGGKAQFPPQLKINSSLQTRKTTAPEISNPLRDLPPEVRLNLLEALALGLRQEEDDVDHGCHGHPAVDPEHPVEADNGLEVGEELDHEEGVEEVPAGHDGAELVAVLRGEELAHEDEGDGGEAEGVADHEEDEAGEREPGEGGVGAVELEVEEGADGGGGEGHDEAGGDQEELAAGLVDQEDGDWKRRVFNA